MKTRFLIAAFAILSACTIQPQGNDLNAQFHMPFTSESWKTDYYTLPSGAKACSISSGYNGINVMLSQRGGMLVKSNRLMQPGETLTANIGSKRFETSDTYFSDTSSAVLVEAMTNGKTLYLEWSEFSKASGGASAKVPGVVGLDGFASQLQQCRSTLK